MARIMSLMATLPVLLECNRNPHNKMPGYEIHIPGILSANISVLILRSGLETGLASSRTAGHLALLRLNHLFHHISADASVLFEVRLPLYPSVSGTPSSFATSNLKRSNAPFASGTTALLEELLFDMIHFLLGCLFVVTLLVYEKIKIIHWQFLHVLVKL